MTKRLFATVYCGEETHFLSLDELEIRLARGQIGQDSHIHCPPLTGDNPQPIWTIESLRGLSDSPEARMMDHLRGDALPRVSMTGLLLIIIAGLLQLRGWLDPLDWGVGWSTISIQDRWWTPWTHWALHRDMAHWVGNAVLFYFCGQRVESIIGSVSLIWVLSIILWGCSLSIWVSEPNVVIGASSWVFGLWAMQVGLGFRLAGSLPDKLRTHYGWGNFIVFLPMLVLNTLSVEISNVAHWSAMGIGGALAFLIRPQTSLKMTERRPKSSLLFNGILHAAMMVYCIQLSTNHFPNIQHHREDSGLHWVVPAGFESVNMCDLNAFEQAGIQLFVGTYWTSKEAQIVDETEEFWHNCGFVEPVCKSVNQHAAVLLPPMVLDNPFWQEIYCEFDNHPAITEHVLKRGEFMVRIGCQANTIAQEWCSEWMEYTKVGVSDIEIAAKRQWIKKDQRATQALLYAQTLTRMGRYHNADKILEEVELRFDGFKWRGTEDRLRLHMIESDWKGERLWLEQVANALPIHEIEVLQLLTVLSINRGWCDIASSAWLRWRGMMPTGLDEVGILVNQCNGD